MATGLPQVWVAEGGVVTHHRQLGVTYVPSGLRLTSSADRHDRRPAMNAPVSERGTVRVTAGEVTSGTVVGRRQRRANV